MIKIDRVAQAKMVREYIISLHKRGKVWKPFPSRGQRVAVACKGQDKTS